MVIEEKKVIGIIREVRISVENETLPLSAFPLDDLVQLINTTLGGGFWKKKGKVHQESFQMLPESYKKIWQHLIENNDRQGCVQILELLENQYKCMYAALSEEEKEKYAKKYKILAINMGNAYSALQFWKHEQHRKHREEKETIWDRGKGVVYTCILGDKLKLNQPEYVNVFWDYVCFTDCEDKWGTKEGIWEYRKLEIEGLTDKNDLFYACKLKPYQVLQGYDYSIWVNPQMQIIGELEQFCECYGKNTSFLAFPAYVQDDIYEVMYTSLHADDENINIRKKRLQYQKEGYPTHYGLINTYVMVREHNDEQLRLVMEDWWNESRQCRQLREFGFSYAAWKHDFDFTICDLFVEWNPYFKNVDLNLDVKLED